MTHTRWTPKLDERLTALWADGMSAREIAQTLGVCSEAAVRARTEKLRLPRRKAPDWTAEQDAALLRMRRERLPFAQIAQTLGRPLAGCRVRYQTLTTRKAIKPIEDAAPATLRLNTHVIGMVNRATARAAAMHKAGMALELVKLDPRAVRLAMEAAS